MSDTLVQQSNPIIDHKTNDIIQQVSTQTLLFMNILSYIYLSTNLL